MKCCLRRQRFGKRKKPKMALRGRVSYHASSPLLSVIAYKDHCFEYFSSGGRRHISVFASKTKFLTISLKVGNFWFGRFADPDYERYGLIGFEPFSMLSKNV